MDITTDILNKMKSTREELLRRLNKLERYNELQDRCKNELNAELEFYLDTNEYGTDVFYVVEILKELPEGLVFTAISNRVDDIFYDVEQYLNNDERID